MGKPGGNADLAQEALGLVPWPVPPGEQHLDGDLATVPQIFGQIDRGHAPATDLFFDPVALRHSGSQAFGTAGMNGR